MKDIKEMPNALRKEMVWRAVGNVQEIISYLYRHDDSRDFTDEQMEEIFYKLNDICIELAENEDMQFQLDDNE